MRFLAMAAAGLATLILLAGSAPAEVRVARSGAVVEGAVMTQGYGCTALELEPVAPWCPEGHFHSGIDLAAPEGTPVHAAAAGRATVMDGAGGYGLHVMLAHGDRELTLYGHLSSVAVRTGDEVSAGAVIGRVGSTGLSTGAHLHFELRKNGEPVDPAVWL